MKKNAAASQSELLAQADLLLLAARLLVSDERDVLPHGGAAELKNLLSTVGAASLRQPLLAAGAYFESMDADTLRAERTRLFEGAVACPINETAYVRRDKGAILADICGFHLAFGFEQADSCGEKPDHLVAELELCAVLLVMQVRAAQQGNQEHAETARDAFRAFLEDHLLAWWPAFSERLLQTTTHPGLHAAAAFHRGLHGYLAGYYDLPEEPVLAAKPDDGTPYGCGLAPDQQVVQLGLPRDPADGFRS